MDWKVDWELSERVVNIAYETHRELGPGLLERVYEQCMSWHLANRGIPFARQMSIPMKLHGEVIPGAFTLDIVVDQRLIIEKKSVERLNHICRSQLITYLKMTGMNSGLLINFNSDPLRDGIQRVVNPK
jgi:iron complex transport system substrate-binding protein